MLKLRWMLCGLVMACAACADVATEDSTAPEEAVQVQTITRSIGPAAETCTVTMGACHAGRCEFPNDTVQSITEVCCNGGVCTTERYRLCGC